MKQNSTFDNQQMPGMPGTPGVPGPIDINEIQRVLYMKSIREVVVYSGKTFAQPQKLLWNLQDENVSPDVEQVFQEHYGGSFQALNRAISKRYAELYGMIRGANARARGIGLKPAEDIDGLIYLLLDADRRKHYRSRIDQYNKRKQAISFAELEEEHRRWGKKPQTADCNP